MVTIKSYTDIEQSRKLAEILPLESADMFHFIHSNNSETIGIGYEKASAEFYSKTQLEYIPCWSLAALLSVLPEIYNYRIEIRHETNCFCCAYTQKDNNGDLYWYYADNPVDACYEIILKLHELNLL